MPVKIAEIIENLQIMTYQETIQYLYDRLPVFHQIGADAYKPGLDKSFRMMAKLGNPQTKYKTIHVGGTNGKGSVSHFLSAVLQSAGYKAGLYTSPHLVDFGERIRVNGKMVKKQFVVDFVENNKDYFSTIEPSFFEATMALAFDYFAEEKVDVAIIEVGLGGRLDSTNIIKPELSVITNISPDHTQFLGDTLDKIAAEKAGIIKTNTPVVIGEAVELTKSVFLEKAKKENAPIFFAQNTQKIDYISEVNGKTQVKSSNFGTLEVGLVGEYQLKNVATVLETITQLRNIGFNIPDEVVRTGLSRVVELTGLQGRWQILQKNPTVVMDTGHNQAGIEFVVNQLKKQNFKTLHFVFGMVNDKDITSVLSMLPQNAKYYFTAANSSRSLPPEQLKTQAEKAELKGDAFSSVAEAVKLALASAEKEDFVFIGGSNFVVGEALELF